MAINERTFYQEEWLDERLERLRPALEEPPETTPLRLGFTTDVLQEIVRRSISANVPLTTIERIAAFDGVASPELAVNIRERGMAMPLDASGEEVMHRYAILGLAARVNALSGMEKP